MSTTATTVDPEVMALLKDAAHWRLLGRLFECPSPAWRADIETLAAELGDGELQGAVAAALFESSEGQYHSVFGPGGPAPPREASYHETLELGSLMSSLAACYHAFGYVPTLLEPPDHVAVEAGFMAFLRLKQAFALAEGEVEHAAVTAAAADTFRTDHLALFAERLAALLAESPFTYLETASRLLAARVGPRTGPKRLTVINQSLDSEESEFSCDAS